MKQASVPEQSVAILGDDALAALLKTGQGNTFENRHDTAILGLLLDTGVRSDELSGMSVESACSSTPTPAMSLQARQLPVNI